jgi:outer membrane protein assembly factor BamB
MSKIDDLCQAQLPYPIKETLRVGELIIALVDDDKPRRYGDRTLNRNVFGFNLDGTLKWQIVEAPDGRRESPKPYTSITVDDGRVTVHNWIGTDYLLNLSDGTVDFYGPPRRPW